MEYTLMIKFELTVRGINRKESEELLRQLDQQDDITLDENLFDADEDFGVDLGSLVVNREDFREVGEVFSAFYTSDRSSSDDHLIINFWEQLPPHLKQRESHSIDRMSDKMLGMKTLKKEINHLRDVDVDFTMYLE
jgi:hypothetical protein